MTEIKMPGKKLLKDIINYALLMKQNFQGLSVGSTPLKQHVRRHLNLMKTRGFFKTFVYFLRVCDSCGKCALGLC